MRVWLGPNLFWAAGLTLALTLVLAVFARDPATAAADFLESHIYHFSLTSTRRQLVAFILCLLAIAALSTAALFRPRKRQAGGCLAMWSAGLAPALAVMVALIGTAPGNLRLFLLIGAVFMVAALIWPGRFLPLARGWNDKRSGLSYGKWAAMVLVLGLVCAHQVFPLFQPVFLRDVFDEIALQTHYAMTLLPAWELLSGEGDAGVWRMNYGPSMIYVSGAIMALLKPWIDMPALLLVRTVQTAQLLALGAMLAVFFLADRRSVVWTAILGIAASLYSLSGFGPAVLHPNQGGLRYLPFLVGLLALIVLCRTDLRRAWIFGLPAGMLLVLSPETGIALGAGLLVAVILRAYRSTTPFRSCAWATVSWLMGAVASALVTAWTSRVVLHDGAGRGGNLLDLFLSGYGGWTDRPSVFAMIAFFLAAFVLLQAVRRASQGRLHRDDAMRGGIATIMLVWLGYYMNRMGEWNLWFQSVLLLAMLAPRWRVRAMIRLYARRSAEAWRAVSLSVMAFSLVLGVGFESVSRVSHYLHVGCPADSIQTEGFCLGADFADPFLGKLAQLETLVTPEDVLVLTVAHFRAADGL